MDKFHLALSALVISLVYFNVMTLIVLRSMSKNVIELSKINKSTSYNDFVIGQANEIQNEKNRKSTEGIPPGLEGFQGVKVDRAEFEKIQVQDLSEIHNYIQG